MTDPNSITTQQQQQQMAQRAVPEAPPNVGSAVGGGQPRY